MRWSPGKLSPGQWQVVVVVAMVLLDAFMILSIVGIAHTYSRHAEVLDESTVDACVERAETDDDRLTGALTSDREVDFDGQDILRVRYARDVRPDLEIHCRYSLPEDNANPPVIEEVWVSKE